MCFQLRKFACVLFLCLPLAASAQDFRIDTEFFDGEEKQPVLETLTIFSGGIVYDFRWTEPKEITVFDPLRGHFTLLDESQRIKAIVTTQELLDFSLQIEKEAARQKGLVAFCAQPDFQQSETALEQHGQTLTELRFASKPLTYVVLGQKAQHAEAAKAYRQFADWCARLNTTVGNLPAAARLSVNQVLAEKELLPLEVTRSSPVGTKTRVLRSEHRFNWKLSREDEKRIERAGDSMAQFEVVSYERYCKDPTNGSSDKTVNKQARR
jgi:hypothetical protein